jgi:GTPase SAR1 family protein
MLSKHEMSDGRRELVKILSERPAHSAEWNEAQNRFQFIDRLLKDCLGWQVPHMQVEEPDGAGGRMDYLLGDSHPAKAILEAKRESVSFGDLPGSTKMQVRKLKPLLEASPQLQSAFNQCLQYCALKGVRLGIVCNGPQLLVFQAFSPHGAPSEGECYFFDGFERYIEHFPLLWKILSPEGISENRAYRDIALHRSPRIPPKASDSIPDPQRYRYRSAFQENIRTLANLLLEEIEDNQQVRRSFYRDCYVSVEANNRHTLLSKQIIKHRYRRATGESVDPKQLKVETELGRIQPIFADTELAAALSTRPVVVLGDVGVGKTSFFENLAFQLEEGEHDDYILLHINLGQKGTIASDLRAFIVQEIVTILRVKYHVNIDSEAFIKSAHHKELVSFDEGPNGALRELNPTQYELRKIDYLNVLAADRAAHLTASLAHLSHGRKKQIVVLIDNADQRNYDTQQQAFLISQELSASGSCLVFVALRPSTFFDSKRRGALSGYQNKIFSISPPPADEVIERRLQFAIRVAEGKQQLDSLEGVRFRLDGIVLFLKATLRSIRSNQDIQGFLGNITGGNTRSVIELVTSFFGSPNVDSEKIIEIERKTGRYQVPLHEFTKHALLGEYSYYNPQSSLYACNVFDVSQSDRREHFLKPAILAFLYSNSGLANRDGFVTGVDIVNEMRSLGFEEDQTRNALRKLSRNRLVETPHAHYREIEVNEGVLPEVFPYRATSIGMYHVRKWIGTFSFLDAVSIDTPIFDEHARTKIIEVAGSFSIHHRMEKARLFRSYLEEQWLSSGIGTSYFDFSEIVRSQDSSFRAVESAVR